MQFAERPYYEGRSESGIGLDNGIGTVPQIGQSANIRGGPRSRATLSGERECISSFSWFSQTYWRSHIKIVLF